MPVSFLATGITASSDTYTPFANLAYALPTGHTTGDLLIACYGGKPYDTTPSTPADYTERAGGANGTTGMGAGSGSVYAVAFTKTHDGSESNPASTFSAQYSPGIRAMLAIRSAGSTWTVTSCKGSDATATSTTFSATGDADLGYAAGDIVVVLLAHNDDSSSDSSFAITIAGCTVADVTQRLTGTLTTSTGNDGRMYVLTARIVSGTSSAAPVVTATTGSGDSDGQAVFLRVQGADWGETVTGTAATVSASALAPTVTTTGGAAVTAASALVSITAQAPSVIGGGTAEAVSATVSTAASIPSVRADATVTATSASFTVAAPSATVTAGAAVAAPAATVATAGHVPGVIAGAKVDATAATATVTALHPPTVTGSALATATTTTVTVTAPTPDVTAGATVETAPAAILGDAPAPAVTVAIIVTVLAPVAPIYTTARPPFVYEYVPIPSMSGTSQVGAMSGATHAAAMTGGSSTTTDASGTDHAGAMTCTTATTTMTRS